MSKCLSWACRYSFDIRYSVFIIRHSIVLHRPPYRRCMLPQIEPCQNTQRRQQASPNPNLYQMSFRVVKAKVPTEVRGQPFFADGAVHRSLDITSARCQGRKVQQQERDPSTRASPRRRPRRPGQPRSCPRTKSK